MLNKANLVDCITIAELEQSTRNDNKRTDCKDSDESELKRVKRRKEDTVCEREKEECLADEVDE